MQAVAAKKERPPRIKPDVPTAARDALLQLLQPLAGFALDAGFSIHEMTTILRAAAVRTVAAQQIRASSRINISGIAASTGIPRAEISRILKGVAAQEVPPRNRSTSRIIAAWREDPKFLDSAGQPADLRIYGKGASFDSLVKTHGRGIPTRAVLDELTRTGSIKVSPAQKVKLKNLTAVDRGMTPQAIKTFGDRTSELMERLLANMGQCTRQSVLLKADMHAHSENRSSGESTNLNAGGENDIGTNDKLKSFYVKTGATHPSTQTQYSAIPELTRSVVAALGVETINTAKRQNFKRK
jgi:hypothetical protein